MLELLPDRSAGTLAKWLQRYPGLEVVARDRSTEYARGITLGAPNAVQVADRWHLLANMRQAVERWLGGAHARLRHLPKMPGCEAMNAPGKRAKAFARTGADVDARAAARGRRLTLHKEVRRRHLAGEPLLAISRALRLARGTVRKYARAEEFPVHSPAHLRSSIIDPHIAWLEAQVAAGHENAASLWRDLRALGFAGTARQVRRWLSEQRTEHARNTPHKWRRPEPTSPDATRTASVFLPSPRQLSWLLVQPSETLSAAEMAITARVEQDPDTMVVAGLARRFTSLIQRCGVGRRTAADTDPVAELASWLNDAQACGVRALTTFAAGIAQDAAAVNAALTTPWSSGQAEGQITRLKLLKRQSYGRASLDLLRQRVLLAV